jgi:integrase
MNRPPKTQAVEVTTGLAAILKSIEKTIDLDQNAALEITQALKKRGLLTIGVSPAEYGKQKLIPFLRDFWDFEKSVYFKDRRAHGKNITKRSCRGAQNIINRHWVRFFNEKTIADITRQELRDFGLSLREQLAGKTVNNILHVGTTALRWAFSEKMIPEDITIRLGGFKGGGKARDIFTDEETEKLFDAKHWKDKMAYTAALLAATSGLRNGEIRALRREDIGNNLYSVKTESGNTIDAYMLYVRHGWNTIDGLKGTKTNTEATVHLLPEIREKLLELLEESPHKNKEGAEQFIFWGRAKNRPCGAQRLLNGLHYAMNEAQIKINGRKLDLHSLRHENGTILLRKTKDIKKVALSLRHKSLKTTEHYTNHQNEEDVAAMGAVAAEAFANILNFQKGKGG